MVKDEYIKVRVSKEQKELFKRVAQLKGITMTDLLVVGTEQLALQEQEKLKQRATVVARAERMDRQIASIKVRMEKRKKFSKKFLIGGR